MKIIVFLIISFYNAVICTLLKDYNDYAAEVANKEFRHEVPTCVIWWKTDAQNIDRFTNLYNGVVMTAFITYLDDKFAKFWKSIMYDQVILYVVNVQEFNHILTLISKHTIRPIRIVLVISEQRDTMEIIEFTKTAWEHDIADIITIHTNKKNSTVLNTFVPYSDGRCGDYTPVSVSINQPTLFKRKFKNFHKCPIRVRAYVLPPYVIIKKQNDTIKTLRGFDADIIKFVLERLNATMVVISDDRKSHSVYDFPNVSYSEGFSDLINNAADVAMPALILTKKGYSLSQVSYAFNDLPFVWCAPRQREIYAWAKAILPFLSRITPLIIVSFVSFIISMKLIYWFGRSLRKVNKNFQLIESFATFLGQGVNFETNYWLSNFGFILWIWYCFIVRIAYQGDLINGLHEVILEPPIKTLKNALQSLNEVVGVPGVLDLYRNTSIEKQFMPIENDDIPLYLKKISNGERILQAVNQILINYSNLNVQILEEKISIFKVCFYMRPRWPASLEFHQMVARITEEGFRIKIFRVYLREWLQSGGGGTAEENRNIALNMVTLSSCFYGLVILYVICFIIFCLEILWFNIFNKNSLERLSTTHF